MKILIIIGVIVVSLLLLFIYSTCVISSRYSCIEEQELKNLRRNL